MTRLRQYPVMNASPHFKNSVIAYHVSRAVMSGLFAPDVRRFPFQTRRTGKGILRKIIHMADISVDEFVNLLKVTPVTNPRIKKPSIA